MNQDSMGDINNPNESLVLVYNRNKNQWIDKTEDIVRIERANYKEKYPRYKIRFSNSQKTYYYNLNAVRIYQNPTQIDATNKVIVIDGDILLEFTKILAFGPMYKIFGSENESWFSEKVEIKIKDVNAEPNIFKYYRDLAQNAAELSRDSDSVESFVYSQYQKIGHIGSMRALYAYIIGNAQKIPFKRHTIFPFHFNLSQKEAVLQAMGNQVSIIEGPPGCGKTQTILNLIVNLVIRGKTAAIVSNNNAAIRNISEKLNEEKVGFISALLGNKNNKTTFFENLNDDKLDEFLSNFSTNEETDAKDDVFHYAEILDYLHKQENLKAVKTIELAKVRKEYEHFVIRFTPQLQENQYKAIPKLSSKASIRVKTIIENTRSFGWIKKLWIRVRYGIQIVENLAMLLMCIDNRYYQAKMEELEENIASISKILSEHNFAVIKAEYERESKTYFRRYLFERYRNYEKKEFSLNSYKSDFLQFTQRYPIILSTSHSLLMSIGSGYLFDYLIVDEASQSDLLSSMLAMYCAKNLVVVGDSKQLEQIDNQAIYDASDRLARRYHIEGKYVYRENSLLGSVRKVFPDSPVTLLKEHYRCPPKIINFINEKYYDGKLVVLTQEQDEVPITIIKLIEGNHARRNPNGTGQYNLREIDEIETYLKDFKVKDIGIISPFRIQVKRYQDRFNGDERIEVDTVHKFQGRQKEAIIISTVVNSIEKNEINEKFIDFINNPKLFNVAVSRAKRLLIMVITHGLYNSRNNNFSDFIRYAEYNMNTMQLLQGKVTSVFDILYSEYTAQLSRFFKRHKHSQDVITEILAFELLKKILLDYPVLRVAMHVSLNKIIQNYTQFSQEEKQYLQNNLTHIDFLIYNHLTNETVLGIEVDGVKYHEQSAKQTLRDTIKNKVFAYNGLTLIRIKTNESNEEMRIRSELDKN